MSNNVPMRQCTRCKKEFPATVEYFYPNKTGKYGLNSTCRQCARDERKEYYWKDPEAGREAARQFAKDHPGYAAQQSRDYKARNPIKRKLQNKASYQRNADKRRRKRRERRLANPEKDKVMHKKYYDEHQDEAIKYGRQYRIKYPEKVRAAVDRWAQEHPEKRKIYDAVRRDRKRNLPHTFTKRDWFQALGYFEYCCAVCGRSFGDERPHADHWIPLKSPDCIGTIPENMIPLCHNCNQTKHAKHYRIWLVERYIHPHVIQEILDRIETYFEWVQTQ